MVCAALPKRLVRLQMEEEIMKRAIVVLFALVLTMAFSGTAFAASVSVNDALGIALRDAGLKQSQVTNIDKERDKNSIEIEFTKKKSRVEYDYKIAKSDGTIISKDVDYPYKHNSSKSKIGKKAALKKVAKHSGISYSVVKKAKCTYKYKKNEGIYTVKFSYKGYRYEYKLLAPTGKVIECEKERTRQIVPGSVA